MRTEGIHIRCGVASLVTVDHDVILTTDIVNDLKQLSVTSVSDDVMSADVVNECDDSCDMNDVDADDDDEVSRRVHNMDDFVIRLCE